MEEILKLLNDYLAIINSSTEIWLVFSSLDEDTSIKESDLYAYYDNFKSIDINKITLDLNNAFLPSYKVNRLINVLNLLKSTYDKYGVNNLYELSLKILDNWNNTKFYNDELIKDILLIERHNKKLLNFDKSLSKIYKDIVENNMINNPNIPIGSSSERLYTMLPDDDSCYKYNLKVISNPMIDWSIYKNGCNALGSFCLKYNNSKNEKESK